ncbi:hypothetical protein LLG95_03165 [bacterium]|nr:hypothetical protein [bacterium]
MTRILFVLMLASMLTLGCGKSHQEKTIENAIENQTGGKTDVNLDKQKMTIETKEGDKMEIGGGEEGIKLPADFPKDIYVYPGAKIEASFKNNDSHQLHLVTADAAAKVIAEYQTQLKKNGWNEKTVTRTGEFSMLEYAKDNRTVVVNASPEGKQTKVMIVMTKEEQAEQKQEQ